MSNRIDVEESNLSAEGEVYTIIHKIVQDLLTKYLFNPDKPSYMKNAETFFKELYRQVSLRFEHPYGPSMHSPEVNWILVKEWHRVVQAMPNILYF